MPLKIDRERERAWTATEARIARQRALFAGLPACEATGTLKLAMLERAWWLLDGGGEGGAEAADALLQFLPTDDVTTLIDQFFDTRNEFDPSLYGAPIGHGQDARLSEQATAPDAKASAAERGEREAEPSEDRRPDRADSYTADEDDL